MATQYLPNQPIVFEDNSQIGLNNDTSTWSVLLQDDDSLCIQQKLLPNGSDIITCELDTEVQQSWFFDTLNTGWSQPSSDFVHTGATGTIEQSFVDSSYIQYKWYKVVIVVTAVSGGALTPYFDNYSVGESWTGTEITTVGTHTQFIQSKLGGFAPIIIATGDITISDVSIYESVFEIAPCFTSDFNSYSVSELGKFCHIAGNNNPLLGNEQVILDGYYVQVLITISGRTQGSVYIQTTSDTSQGPCIGNGNFIRYLNNTSGSAEELKIVPDNDFDGCISNVHVYQLENTGGFEIFSDTGVSKSVFYDKDSANNAVTIYKDRISWCISFDSVDNESGLIQLEEGCYKIGYYDSQDAAVVYSTNLISYSTTSFEKTKMLQGTCNGEALGFIFTNANFTLWQRLPIFRINPKYQVEADDYIDSLGVRSKSSVRKEKVKTFWVDYIDEVAHDCLSTIVVCDTVELDGEQIYFPVQDYEPEWDASQKYNKAQVKLDVKLSPAALYNKNC